MSSVCAVWVRGDCTPPSRLLTAMQAAQAAYGPDRTFQWCDSELALGGNLLRLLPEDQNDDASLWSRDGRHCMVADVRLDNRSDLVRELHLSTTELLTDSTILLAAWQRWEEQCLDHVLGSFAFVVWTPSSRRLFAARDHAGDRPLCFHAGPGFFAVASLPKGVLALPGVNQGLDRERIVEALILALPGPRRTFYQGVEQLPMGHCVRVTPDAVHVRRYWSPVNGKPVRFQRDADYPEAMRELLDRATEARLRSTRPIGAHLSAGLDSSSVAVSAALELARRGQRLTAFTAVPRPGFQGVGFHGRLPDEGPAAADVVGMHPNMDHVLVDAAGQDLVALLRSQSELVDEPVQNGINTLWISAIAQQAQSRGLGVLLQGPRGNATISYNGFEGLSRMFRSGRWLRLLGTIRRMRANGMTSWRQGAWLATDGLLPRALSLRLQKAQDFTLAYSAANPQLLQGLNLRQRMIDEFFPDSTDLAAAQTVFYERFDYGTYNAEFRASYGLDTRDPTCDKRLFDFCYNIPIEQYLVGSVHRSLVRRAMVGRLPAETLKRSIRGQQGADWYVSMRDNIDALRAQAPAIDASPIARQMLDLPRMHHLLNTFPQDGLEQLETSQSYGDALCRFISFGLFFARQDQLTQTPLE